MLLTKPLSYELKLGYRQNCATTSICATATLIWARYAAPAVLVLKYLKISAQNISKYRPKYRPKYFRYAAPAVLVLKYLTLGPKRSNSCWTPAGLLLQFYGRVRRHSQKKSRLLCISYVCIYIYIYCIARQPHALGQGLLLQIYGRVCAYADVCGRMLTYADVCQAFWTTSGTPLSA